jgi:hypothetical protein
MNERLLAIIARFHGEKRGGKAAFAHKIGAHTANLNGWLHGKSEPGADYRRAICHEYGINRDWLDTGAGAMLGDTPAPESPVQLKCDPNKDLFQAQAEAKVWRDAYHALLEKVGRPIPSLQSFAEAAENESALNGSIIAKPAPKHKPCLGD